MPEQPSDDYFHDFITSEGPADDDFPALETPCGDCRGEGEVSAGISDRPDLKSACYSCDGFGRVPTPFGEAVLAFVAERMRLGQKRL
jgi:hypothetical protein